MDSNLELAYQRIMDAVSAEEVFGVTDVVLPPDEMLGFLAEEYKRLEEIVKPDAYVNLDDREAATDASKKLEQFYSTAQERIRQGLYGLGGARTAPRTGRKFKTGKRAYIVGEVLAHGDLSTVYEGMCEIGDEVAGQVIIKVIDDPQDNDLAGNEIRNLQLLHSSPAPQWKHVPFFLDQFVTGGRTGIVLRRFNGYTLEQVMEHPRYRGGVNRKHMVWMLNRALSALGYAHSLGLVHGNIDPSHVMVKPDDHNLCVLDWSYASLKPAATGEGFKVVTPIYSPPEVEKKKPPLPSSDIYSLGKVMIWILGGNPETNEIPEEVEIELRRFLLWFVEESPLQRPQDAWNLHGDLIALVEKLWGPRKFLKFSMD